MSFIKTNLRFSNLQECSRLAFAKHGRSLQASDLTEQVHIAFMNLFGEASE